MHEPGAGHDTVVSWPPGATAMALDHGPTGDGCVVEVVVDDVDAVAAWLGDELHDAASRLIAPTTRISPARRLRTSCS